MSRAEEVRARYEAELAVAELEEQLLAAKDAGGDVPRELKDQLREARRVFREMRSGDAAVNPSTIEAIAEVQP